MVGREEIHTASPAWIRIAAERVTAFLSVGCCLVYPSPLQPCWEVLSLALSQMGVVALGKGHQPSEDPQREQLSPSGRGADIPKF